MNFSQRSNVQNYPSGLTLSNGELFPNATESSSGQIANLKGLPNFRSGDKKNTGTNPVLLSFGPKKKWPRRPDLPFRNRSDLREFSWPDILGERTVEAVVLKLLEHLGRPTRHAGNRENWREEIRRDIE